MTLYWLRDFYHFASVPESEKIIIQYLGILKTGCCSIDLLTEIELIMEMKIYYTIAIKK